MDDDSARRLFPTPRPRGIREAIERALLNEDREFARTRWSDALSTGDTRERGGVTFGSRLVDSRSARGIVEAILGAPAGREGPRVAGGR